MNEIFKIFIIIFILTSYDLFALPLKWTNMHTYSLKKDITANILINNRVTNENNNLIFRWTLSVQNRVTILLKYNKYPHQYILYNKNKLLNKIKLKVFSGGINQYENSSYIIIELSKIAKSKIDFNIYVRDNNNKINVIFSPLKNKIGI